MHTQQKRVLKLYLNKKKQMRRYLVGTLTISILIITGLNMKDVDCFVYDIGGRVMRKYMDPELAHDLVMMMASYDLLPRDLGIDAPILKANVSGIHFDNPIGLAAGFDKDAEAPLSLIKLGFGSVEVGSVTPKPQSGNPKPRIFRLTDDWGVINRCGFNSKGVEYMERNLHRSVLAREKDELASTGVIGVNLGKNKETTDAASDMQMCVKQVGTYADYLVINVSSPNTPNLRGFQKKDQLTHIIKSVMAEIDTLETRLKSENKSFENKHHQKPPLFVKIAPDLTDEEKIDIASACIECGIGGLIVCNTTVSRPPLHHTHKTQTGGLSGLPLKDMSTKCVSDMYKLTDGKLPIIAVGGIFTGSDALEKIEAGAQLCQIYTSFIYLGTIAARNIKSELADCLTRKGYASIQDAVGAAHKPKKQTAARIFAIKSA